MNVLLALGLGTLAASAVLLGLEAPLTIKMMLLILLWLLALSSGIKIMNRLVHVKPHTLLVIKGLFGERIHIGERYVAAPHPFEQLFVRMPLHTLDNSLTFGEVSINAHSSLRRLALRVQYQIMPQRWQALLAVPNWGRRSRTYTQQLDLSLDSALQTPFFWEMLLEDVIEGEVQRLLAIGRLQDIPAVEALVHNQHTGTIILRSLHALHNQLQQHLERELRLRAATWGLHLQSVEITALELHDMNVVREVANQRLRSHGAAEALRVSREVVSSTSIDHLKHSLNTIQETVQPSDHLLAHLLSNAIREAHAAPVYVQQDEIGAAQPERARAVGAPTPKGFPQLRSSHQSDDIHSGN